VNHGLSADRWGMNPPWVLDVFRPSYQLLPGCTLGRVGGIY